MKTGIKLAANAVPQRLASLLKQNNNLRAFLLYGNDESRLQASQTDVVTAIKSVTSVDIKDLSAAQVQNGEVFLQDELSAVSLLGGTELFRVKDIDDKFLEIAETLKLQQTQHYLVLLAGSLTAKSPFRKWAESNPHFVSIGCYAEEGANLSAAIANELRAHNKRFDNDAIAMLADALSGDLMLLKQEVEKLVLYKGEDTSPISKADVSASIAGHVEEESEELFFALLNRNDSAIIHSLNRLEAQNSPVVQIIRFLLQQWIRLLQAAYIAEFEGLSPSDALDRIKPPFFFKQLPVLRRALPHWKVKQIESAISLLLKIEKEAKLNAHHSYAILAQRLAASSNALV